MNDVAAATTDSKANYEKKITGMESIISAFLPVEQVREIKRTLLLLCLLYIRSERIEGDSQTTRDVIAFHLTVLNDLVDAVIKYLMLEDPEIATLVDSICITGYEPEVLETINQLSIMVIRSEEATELSLGQRDEISNHLNMLVYAIDKLIEISNIEQGE